MRTLLFLLLVLPSFAGETWVLPDGNTYTDVEVTRQDEHRVTITHSSGVARIPYSSLTPELMTRFGKTAEDAATAKVDERQAKEEAAAR